MCNGGVLETCQRWPAFFAVVLAMVVPLAWSHGYLEDPPARSTIAFQRGTFYNPSSGNGVGTDHGGDPGPCGDPFQTDNTDFLGQKWDGQATYRAGGTISTTVTLMTNHGGSFSVYLCKSRSPSELTLDCFFKTPLINTETGTERWWIQDVSQNEWKHTMEWQLPERFACARGCVLMWEYDAMQTCILPCKCDACGEYCKSINPVGGYRPACGEQGGKLEIFRNCADITIEP